MSKAGIMGEAHKLNIDNGGEFWVDMYKSTLIRSLEMGYKTEVMRTHGISDVVIVPGDKHKSEQVLVKWYKRILPLTDEQLMDKYGRLDSQTETEE